MSDRRREFPKAIRAQIVNRAMNADGQIVCEGCGLVLAGKRYEIDHTLAEALVLDKSKPLTAEDGRLLGVTCCHRPKTTEDVGRIAKADRQRNKHLRLDKPSGFRRVSGARFDWKRGRYVTEQEGGR